MGRKNITTDEGYFLLLSLGAFANQMEAEEAGFANCIGGITWKQYCVLKEIRRFDYAPSIAELAESLGTSRQNTKGLLLRLMQKDLVTLSYEENNKKRQRIRITEKCNESLADYDDRTTQLITEALKGVSSEQVQTTLDTINRIRQNIEDYCYPCYPTGIGCLPLPPIKITTLKGKQVEADNFTFGLILSREKGQPKYQLYASKGSLLQITGVNRYVVGYYDNKSQILKEIIEITDARLNHKATYKPKYRIDIPADE